MRLKLIFFCIIIIIKSYPQGGLENTSDLNKVTPVSPISASFEKYGVHNVNLSAGVVSPTIPLFTIPVGSARYNVNLNYSTQGIRVDEFAGSVGMGWSVNLGSITRSVRDLPDEMNGTLRELPALIGDNLFYVGNSLSEDITVDSEYDVFNVNVDGISTKFMLEADANLNFTIKKLVKDDVKVEFAGASAANGTSPYIMVTSPSGTKYFFGGNGAVETSFTRPANVSGVPPTMYTTAWMLSRIEYTNNKKIDLYYTHHDITFNDSISQTALIKFLVPDSMNAGLPQLMGANTSAAYNRSQMCVPHQIVADNLNIKFNKSTFLNYISNYPSLNSIEISYQSRVNKNIAFTYDYYPSIEKGLNAFSESTYRPFLSKIQFEDAQHQIINDYKFEYHKPDQMPGRLSFSQDLLGYYNGSNNKNFIFNSLKDYNILPDYNAIADSPEKFNNFLYGVTGDRKPNKNYAENGSLKKIIYPAKGYTLFEYDGNRTDIRELVYPSFQNFDVEVLPNDGVKSYTSQESLTVPFDQSVYLTHFMLEFLTDYDSSYCYPESFPVNKKRASFNILDEYNQLVTIYTVSETGNISGNSTITVVGENVHNYYFSEGSQARVYAKLLANKIYKIQLTTSGCQNAKVKFVYYDSLASEGNFVEAGGLRIKTITNLDSNGSQIGKKSFDYSDGAYINGKPLSVLDKKDIEIQMLSESGQSTVGIATTKEYVITSGTRSSIRNSSGEFYAYNKVTEYDLDQNNDKKGRTDHYFDVYQIGPAIPVQNYSTSSQNFIDITPGINESKTELFDNQNNLIQSTSYNYSLNQNYLNQRHNSFTAKKTLEVKCSSYGGYNTFINCNDSFSTGGLHATADERWWSIMKSYGSEKWITLNSKSVTEYYHGMPITTETKYFYDNPAHFQVTSQISNFPDFTNQETAYKYSHEKENQFLKDKNMIGIPLETEVKKNGIIISKTETKYPVSQADADAKTSGLPLPMSVSGLDLQSNAMNMGVLYKKYDTQGNLLQYNLQPNSSGDSGNPVTIIWGYGNTQPIAKVEGVGYDALMAFPGIPTIIADLQSKSAADKDVATEQILISALDSFRKNSYLSAHPITTYTYNPLVGVTSITPPSGIREIYLYDTANRLQSVKDVNGNVLKEYEYHYKP